VSDTSVAAAIRSAARLVLIEAPGGCGKTFQASHYASELAATIAPGRMLVVTHTHAACDVFASRIKGSNRVDIRTIDSLISQIASAYHSGIGLPADPSAWARKNGNEGYRELAAKTAALVATSPMVAHALARRYPLIVCDEHQDASAEQHAIIMALHAAGSSLRLFGDPMQHIGGGAKSAARSGDTQRWADLKAQADVCEELDFPHRWNQNARRLGDWILAARLTLKQGGRLDLRGPLPSGVTVILAEDIAKASDQYALSGVERRPIDAHLEGRDPILILSAHNRTVQALRSFFNRRVPIWEGHTRDALAALASALEHGAGDANAVVLALVNFMDKVSVGFTATDYTKFLRSEVAAGCTKKRSLKPAALQGLGRLLLADPTHRGAAAFLHLLSQLIETDPKFAPIKIDSPREFREAIRLDDFENCQDGLTEIARRRTHSRPMPPDRAISTVHKAKGLEAMRVIIMPCNSKHFPDNEAARNLLYVAISRATQSLTLVVSRSDPSPLLLV
jgi:hypothetical protein